MIEKIMSILASLFLRYEKRQRFSMFMNCLIVMFVGASIGTICAWMVLTINDFLPSPWSYLCAIAVPLLTKTVVMWFGTLLVGPFIRKLLPIIFKSLTGITVRPNQIPSIKITGNIMTLPVAATIAITIYLSGLKPDSVNYISDKLIYYIAILVGVVASLTENLSNPTVIRAIWHNRSEYQDSPLYQRSQRVVPKKQTSRSARIDNTPTRAQKRRAKRNRRKGNRRP